MQNTHQYFIADVLLWLVARILALLGNSLCGFCLTQKFRIKNKSVVVSIRQASVLSACCEFTNYSHSGRSLISVVVGLFSSSVV